MRRGSIAEQEHAWPTGETAVCGLCHPLRDWLSAEMLVDRLADLERDYAAAPRVLRFGLCHGDLPRRRALPVSP
jgi:hypothetical protein